MKTDSKDELTVEDLIALVLADVDTFLLRDETQVNYKNQKTFTREEIINQLEKTAAKLYGILSKMGCNLESKIPFDPMRLMMYEMATKSDKTIN